MAVAYGGVGNGAGHATSGPITPALPAGTVEGNAIYLLVFALGTSVTPTINTPTNWALIRTGTNLTYRLSMFRRIVPPGGMSAPSVSSNGNNGLYAICTRYTGVHTSTPEDVAVPAAQTGNSATPTAPTVTTVTPDGMVAYFYAQFDDNEIVSPNNGATLSWGGASYSTTTGGDACLAAAHKAMPVAGVAGATAMDSLTDPWIGITIPLRRQGVAITANLGVIDISHSVQPITAANVVSTGEPVDTSLEVLGVTQQHIANITPVDTTLEVLEVVRTFNPLPTVTTNVSIVGVTAAKIYPLDVIDIDVSTGITAFPLVQHVANLDVIDIGIAIPVMTFRLSNVDPQSVTLEIMPVTIGFGVDYSGAFTRAYVPPSTDNIRFIAQSILTGEFLDWELPISNPTIKYTLSGPTIISGEFDPEIRELQDVGLEPWATWIHMEDNGVIRASGILQPASIPSEGESLSVEAMGPSVYPIDTPYLSVMSLINTDPADIVRLIWAHLQSYTDAQLGVVVTGTTPVKIGKPLPPEPPEGQQPDPNTKDDKPYELVYFEASDCGAEIGKLAQETPFDFVERAEWNADKTDVLHFIDIKYPRAGTRRFDLGFREGENIVAGVGTEEETDFYASDVVLFGKGEGREIVIGYAGKRGPNGRVRRVKVLTDSTIGEQGRANKLSREELERSQALLGVQAIEIDARHENAKFGTFTVGDEILVEADIPWVGPVQQWERIISYSFSPDTENIAIELRRAETFLGA